MEIKVTHAPRRPNGWHTIDATSSRTEASKTSAMNVAGGVMVKQVERVLDAEGWPTGVSTSLAFVPGATVAKRWTITEVEAHFDEEEGVEVEAHRLLQKEIRMLGDSALCDRAEVVDGHTLWWSPADDELPSAEQMRAEFERLST